MACLRVFYRASLPVSSGESPTRSISGTGRYCSHTGKGHCDIVETGNDSWRFKSRDDDHATRARHVSATPAKSDEASATFKTRR